MSDDALVHPASRDSESQERVDDPSGVEEIESWRTPQAIAWGVGMLGLACFVTLLRITTHLGAKAYYWDNRGREWIWRVWTRSSHDLVTIHPQWLLGLTLFGLLAVGVVAVCLVLWLLLTPEPDAAPIDG